MVEKLTDENRRLVELVIERAEQACRYALKHQEIEAGPYRDGFETACELCEAVIKDHVWRHIEQDAALQEGSGE